MNTPDRLIALGDSAPGGERVRALADAIDGFDATIRQAEAARLVALVSFLEEYRITSNYCGDGSEAYVEIGHEGTPLVGEFAVLEIAALLRMSKETAWGFASQALDLKYRLPGLWRLVVDAEVPVWQGLKVVEMTRHLSLDAAAFIDREVTRTLPVQGWTRVRASLPRWVLAADRSAAQRSAELARAERQVWVSGISDGCTEIYAKVDARDGVDFDAALDQIASTLPVDVDNPNDAQRRRAAAVGVLARQAFGQDALPVHTLVVHINATDPALPSASPVTSDGVATVERWGSVLTTELPAFLKDSKVIVRPILDPASLGATNPHDPSETMRFALDQRNPFDVFPYGSRPARSCDADHTREYVAGVAGQTRLDNLGPLSRTAHRAKTHSGWHLLQDEPGVFTWQTPLGYRYRVTPYGTVRLDDPHVSRVRDTSSQAPRSTLTRWPDISHWPDPGDLPKSTPWSTGGHRIRRRQRVVVTIGDGIPPDKVASSDDPPPF